ncbi:nrdD [Aeromonas phage 31]|uniref:NrdD n=2 Tax=Biquartavirus TaxID=1912143 RepID=Q56EU7_9CAUD|nr:NrdD-like anaerobic ribonucleotide reductase large subunit [Aeromonas phage 31]APU00958.1 ribonucleotide reductase of class III (anaerobic) large subunit [Aeromonas phage 31.2]APU02366.1 ribonucleotide reductase of class III (anaerobic) large subunit [Aeromonas phage SW69-9]UYD59627.1 anaerobic ribonucleoside-triphosphate reductase [Aeromonas phage avDM5]UYD60399.1 anaerobic ribonucleoside-triphosphate reductase [Aeromonas phage avDM2]AAX63553.1 nrdD [Aeromonas phage 31]
MTIRTQVKELVRGQSESHNENANKNADVIPTMRDMMASIASKDFSASILPIHLLQAHKSGDIHIHDMDYAFTIPMTNCCLVNLGGMLSRGFKMGDAHIEQPKSFGVACAIMAQITAQVSSHQYGGTTLANIDQVLAKYAVKSWEKHLAMARRFGLPNNDAGIYADELTQKEIYDGIQAFEYEVNTMFTTNGQTPFVTITFGMGTNWFEREIQKAILNVRIKGLGKNGITPVFPKLVMFMEDGLNLRKGDPNYEIKQLAMECATKRMYPDIISAKNNRSITGSQVPVSPMGCRSFLAGIESGELNGRNNLGVVSINIPRIAIESNGNVDTFYELLKSRFAISYEASMERIKWLKGAKAKVAPILYTEGAFGLYLDPEEEFLPHLKPRASISIGYIGLYEAALHMTGESTAASPRARKFAEDVAALMHNMCVDAKNESGWSFSLYSTPSESLCDRLQRLDREKYGVIPGVTDKDWYTNSFHVPVEAELNPYDKIDFEKNFHWIASGGHISYVELPNMRRNIEALEQIWDYAMENLSYFGTNTPVDKCYDCGYDGEFKCTSKGFSCPACGNHDSSKMSVIRRVCGYLGAPLARGFNKGKQSEVAHRVKHVK